MLGAGFQPTPLSADLEERTVAAALAAPSSTAPGRRWRAALVAVAAAVFLVAVGAIVGYVTAPPSGFEAFMQTEGVRLVPFDAGEGGTGTMTLAVAPDGRSAYVIGAGVEAPPSGEVYELWTISGKTPTSLGCLVPSDGFVSQPLTGSFDTADVAAMTVESAACPAAPTTAAGSGGCALGSPPPSCVPFRPRGKMPADPGSPGSDGGTARARAAVFHAQQPLVS